MIVTTGSEPTIQGTSIEVYRIVALLDGGMNEDEILADYPSLDREAMAAVKLYADTHPKKDNLYPSQSFKSAMRNLDLSALDDL